MAVQIPGEQIVRFLRRVSLQLRRHVDVHVHREAGLAVTQCGQPGETVALDFGPEHGLMLTGKVRATGRV